MGHCNLPSRCPCSTIDYQCCHSYLCYLIFQRLPLHRIPISVRFGSEWAGSQIPPHMLKEVSRPKSSQKSLSNTHAQNRGVPYYCISITAAMSLLTYLSCSAGSQKVFTWFQNLTTISVLFTWMSISIAYIRFHSTLAARGIDRRTLIFRSPFQPYTAWFSLIFFAIITLFNGFWTFPSSTKKFDVNDFFTAYVGIPIYCALYAFWKVHKRTRWVPSGEADIVTGKAALDAADKHWPERIPRNMIERIWFWIA